MGVERTQRGHAATAEFDPNSDIRHAGVSKPLECYERCVDSRRDILQPIVVAFTQQLLEIECPLLWHRRALPLCVYDTNGLRWPFAALLAVAGLAWGASHGKPSSAARADPASL